MSVRAVLILPFLALVVYVWAAPSELKSDEELKLSIFGDIAFRDNVDKVVRVPVLDETGRTWLPDRYMLVLKKSAKVVPDSNMKLTDQEVPDEQEPSTVLFVPDFTDNAEDLRSFEEASSDLHLPVGGLDEYAHQGRYNWQAFQAALAYILTALARLPVVVMTGNVSATSVPQPTRSLVEVVQLPVYDGASDFTSFLNDDVESFESLALESLLPHLG